MGLRCLLGHDFGEPETERERNEEGNEVVVTVREVKTCQRCGEKQVVSENKEIKSIDQLRESANAGPTGGPSASEPATSDPAGDDGWSTGGSVGGVDEPTSAGESESSAEQWSTDELEVGSDSTQSEPAEPSVGTEDTDDVDEGVAEIIESAEREDDMLQSGESEGPAAETEADETPVHPGRRSADDEAPDTSEEDAEILDGDSGEPEERREQWDEEADPSQVPGQDQTDVEEDASDGEDAIIMGGDEAPVDEDQPPEPVETEPTESEPTEQADDEPTAVESEDAVILDDDSGEPEPAEPTEAETTGDDVVEPEDAVAMDESTEETGHTPWPETPGEDEGHDATEPDGEPADVEFGGGLTPDDPRHDENGAQAGASTETDPSQPTAESGADAAGAEESSGTQAPEPNINLEQSSREAQLEYYCSECGLTRDVGNSSMRAGDICPDCRKGYITEREKAE